MASVSSEGSVARAALDMRYDDMAMRPTLEPTVAKLSSTARITHQRKGAISLKRRANVFTVLL
jgi:hypothetical protein